MAENAPLRIGDYEIVRELGHGGMGKVFLARNVLSDRLEAMKVILPDLAARREFVARFMREIKTLAGLEHPNIAALRTAFTAGDQFVMIMEYVDGVSLAEVLHRGRLPAADAVSYTEQVLSALSFAHARHIIHRDIKPGNMMLTPQGVVKLMDFGIARSADAVGLTMTGETLGSLDYASPEQVQAMPTDERSDLYSVGVSLYQMVTGQRMFEATSSFSIMQAQVREIPREPMTIVPSVPKALNDLIMKSIAKNPADRFQSADEFREALLHLEQANPQLAPVAAPTSETVSPPSWVAAPPPPMPTSAMVTPAPTPVRPGNPINRSLLLVVGVVLVAALLAGDAVYKSHQQRLSQQPIPSSAPAATVQPAGATAAVDTASAPPVTPPPPSTETTASAQNQAPGTQPRKVKAQLATPAPPSGPSDAEIQAQQQAALEQKKLFDSLETEADQLNGRAAALDSSLNTLEQQMHASGVGLRGDMVSARSNLHNDLDKAAQALNSGDTERAQHFLGLAQREAEKLEAFLGHR